MKPESSVDPRLLRGVVVLVGITGILAGAGLLLMPSTAAASPAPSPPGPSVWERLSGLLTPTGRTIHETLAPFEAGIQRAAATWGLDPDLLRAVIWTESKGDPLASRFEPKISDTSYGLMQILLGTARSLGFPGTPYDLVEPGTNIMLGAQYLRSRFDEYSDWRLSVASYNSGSPILANGVLVNESYVNDVRANLAALTGGEMPVA